MNRIKVMINGIPGNVAVVMAKHTLMDERFELIPYSLTGPEITENNYQLNDFSVRLLRPDERAMAIIGIKDKEGAFISIDYTHPSAVNGNAEFYCKHSLPFVMGTTGGDRELLAGTVAKASISAVIAPNMAKQIVGFQAMMEWCADAFPGLFKGYSLEIKESHQKGKADTSGTAKALVECFRNMGVNCSEKNIIKERDPEIQKKVWDVPEEFLGGHGYHKYTLISEDKTVKFEFGHNINGRDVYVQGTLDAVVFLNQKIEESIHGRVFSMMDVLRK
ncbi:4-hydroxy-tetrahydrodipicolinate reductase [Desulfosarcina sp. BuS5]|uniref:dihydrodipicolinate reductase n=1 Tax=Desulfosarcina sp. BuS5 TaxID=933262 RepID=UPI000484357A|nr:dihydrodipicolinate reductase [Desulfosarcina sp. BuS5]WDN87379.1 4-hydroxy-tetrahydrodipicolinate reductase [Desulfosarcina sp. BuS5]